MAKKRKQPKEQPTPAPEPTRRRGKYAWITLGAIATTALAATLAADQPADDLPAVYSYKVVSRFKHDRTAFCQGLVFHKGMLYESTGHYGKSTVRSVNLETGAVTQQHQLPDKYFGEGLAQVGDRLVQLTWTAGVGLVYDVKTLKQTGSFRYRGEGWGLTFDGQHLVMSNGTDRLQFLDPETYKVVRTLQVRHRGKRVNRLNELEFINGEIFANVWQEDYIARISPQTGQVLGWIDLRGILKSRRRRDDVLNGIAYDSANDRLFVTGKNWPALFEIKLKAK